MADKTDRVLNRFRKQDNEVRQAVADEMYLPNVSGDHKRSIKLNTPTGDKDLVNKEYTDTTVAGHTLDDAYNAESGDHNINVDDGIIFFNYTNSSGVVHHIADNNSGWSVREDLGNTPVLGVAAKEGVFYTFSQRWEPLIDATYDLGTPTLRWRNGYFSGIVYQGQQGLETMKIETTGEIISVHNVTCANLICPGSGHDGFSDFVANEHIDWTNASVALTTTGDIISNGGNVTSTKSAGTANLIVTNTSTGGANVSISSQTGSSDPTVTWQINPAGQSYTMGIDNSDSDSFVLSRGNILGTTPIMTVTSAGAVTTAGNWDFGSGNLTTTGTLGSGAATITGVSTITPGASGTVTFENNRITFETTITAGAAHLLLIDADNSKTRPIIHAKGNRGAIEALYVASSGSVGIGTSNVDEILHIENSSANSTPTVKVENDAVGWNLRVDGSSSDQFRIFRTGQSNSFSINTSNKIFHHFDTEHQGDTFWTSDGSGLDFAEISAQANTVATVIPFQGVAVQFIGFGNNGVSNSAVPDHTNDHITITRAGMYQIICSISCESVAAGGADTFFFQIYKNNGATALANMRMCRDLAGGQGDVGAITISGIADLAANDTIELWVTNGDSADNILLIDVNLQVVMVGGT